MQQIHLFIRLCTFSPFREEITEHLTQHIMSIDDNKNLKNNNSIEIINMALNQLRFFHNQENQPTSSGNGGQEEDQNSEQPEVSTINSQGKKKIFRCKHCDFTAISKFEFWNHAPEHMNPNKIMRCYLCPFVTEYKHHLKYHLLKHSGSKPYKCSECTYTCMTKSMLRSHSKSHSDIYAYSCKDCKYASRHIHTIKQHSRKYGHQPAAVLNADGTESDKVIDVYGRKRGPKKPHDNHANKETSTSTWTATAGSVQTEEQSTSTTTQTVANSEDGSNSNRIETTVQRSTSTSSQMLQSTSSGSAPSTVPEASSTFIFQSIFNSMRDRNLVIQKDERTGQERVHYPFQYNHRSFTALNTKQTTSTTTASGNSERENHEDSEANMTTPTMDTSAVDQPKFLGNSTAENTAIPIDLTSKLLSSDASSNQMPCQVSPLNLVKSSKTASTRRRKGISIDLQRRTVEKEEDTDEETKQNEKRPCQSVSLQPPSAPSTSSRIASIPSTSFTTAFTSSTSFLAASTSSSSLMDTTAQTAVSFSLGNSGAYFAGGQNDEEVTHNRSPSNRDFICLHCDIAFPDQTVYIAHTRFHDNREPFMCNVCGNSYDNREAFNLHIFENRCRKQ